MASLPVAVRQTDGGQSDERVQEGYNEYCSLTGAEIPREIHMMCWRVREKPQLLIL